MQSNKKTELWIIGIILMGVGVLLTIIGPTIQPALLQQLDEATGNRPNILGSILIIIGSGVSVAGLICFIKGMINKKNKQ